MGAPLFAGGGAADFNFFGGDIYLTGDIRGIGDYSWFNVLGNSANYTEEYDAGITHLSYVVPEPMSIALMGLGGLLLRRKR